MNFLLFGRRIDIVTCKRMLTIILSAGLFCLWASAAGTADPAPKSYASYGTFRYAMVHVLSGVNLDDAAVAIKLHWSKHLAYAFPGMASEFEILLDTDVAADKVREGQLHGLSMGVAQYLKMRRQVKMKPVFVSSRLSDPLESYLLLVRRGSSWKSLGALSDRRLVLEKTLASHIGQMWLETLLHGRGLPSARQYFTEINLADKPARIVLPVFFDQADACLVPESAYRTMTELNPQIGRKLDILARSPGLVKTIHCATGLMPDHMVERFIQKGVSMEDTYDGRQLLLIFHVKKNFVFQPEFLADSERIFLEYEKLPSSN